MRKGRHRIAHLATGGSSGPSSPGRMLLKPFATRFEEADGAHLDCGWYSHLWMKLRDINTCGREALQLKLHLFLGEEMRKWERTFPDQLWIEFGRLTKWTGPVHSRPKYWGKLVNELIYEYLDRDDGCSLQNNARVTGKDGRALWEGTGCN
jgi:hypothetical protein